jgi:membrane protein DedA with SNARE-associated domain
MLNELTDLITDIVETLGPLGVAVLVALENVFPPIPSEVVLPLAGFVAGRGEASLIAMMIGATVGSVVGAWILYGIAAAVGADRLHRFVGRYGRWFGLKSHDLERAEQWFDRRSGAAVLVGRCIPLIRSIVSIPAGFRRMPFVRFTVLTALGSAVWNVALIGAGAVLGERWEAVGDVVGLLQGAVIIAIVAGVAFFVWKRFVKPRLASAGDLPPTDEELTG